ASPRRCNGDHAEIAAAPEDAARIDPREAGDGAIDFESEDRVGDAGVGEDGGGADGVEARALPGRRRLDDRPGRERIGGVGTMGGTSQSSTIGGVRSPASYRVPAQCDATLRRYAWR